MSCQSIQLVGKVVSEKSENDSEGAYLYIYGREFMARLLQLVRCNSLENGVCSVFCNPYKCKYLRV